MDNLKKGKVVCWIANILRVIASRIDGKNYVRINDRLSELNILRYEKIRDKLIDKRDNGELSSTGMKLYEEIKAREKECNQLNKDIK